MTLGGSFPAHWLEQHIRNGLLPGTVVKLRRRMDDGLQHEKRHIVVCVDELTTTCVINSDISQFIQSRPPLLRCQVLMRSDRHSFMNYDSHIDCSKTHSYQTNSVVQELVQKPEWLLGKITADLRDNMLGAIKYSPLLSPADVGRLCESLASIDCE